MLLQIAQNPHIVDDDERHELWNRLQQMYEGEIHEEQSAATDVLGLERLKFIMSGNPRIVVK